MIDAPSRKTFAWIVLFAFTGIIDLIQIIIGFTGFGIGISETIEPLMPITLLILFALFKIPIINKPKRLVSLFAVGLGDALTGGIAPFWILDIWYIYRDVKNEDAQEIEDLTRAQSLGTVDRQPYYSEGMRKPKQNVSPVASPLNKNGVRPPSGGLLRN